MTVRRADGRRTNRVVIRIAILLVLGGNVFAQGAFGQQQAATLQRQLAGTWTLSSQYMKMPDGSRVEPYGPGTKGSLMLDPTGRFSFQVIGANRPKFKSGARREGTPEENAAAVFNTETFFGTYSVNEADHILTLHLERAILPNWDGIDRTYKIILKGDALQLEGPPSASSRGPMIPYTDWARAR